MSDAWKGVKGELEASYLSLLEQLSVSLLLTNLYYRFVSSRLKQRRCCIMGAHAPLTRSEINVTILMKINNIATLTRLSELPSRRLHILADSAGRKLPTGNYKN